ncbi:hypothetical protein QTP88_006918 [Uroleucon formosanum]
MNKTSSRNTKQPMVISTTASEPFERVFIDGVGPLTPTYQGNVYILTLQCDLTKFSVATPMANKEANTVAYHFVTSFVRIHGIPQNLISDQGTEFLNKIFSETCKLIGVKRINTFPYHPQANSALERSHRTLGEYLRHYVDADQQNWDTYIPYAIFTYNSSEHQSTGKQPYALLYHIGVPRTVLIINSPMNELRSFSRSHMMYVSLAPSGTITVSQFISKSRVYPQKSITIPRFKLSKALLLAELVHNVLFELAKVNIIINSSNIMLWSYSTIVLFWINTS